MSFIAAFIFAISTVAHSTAKPNTMLLSACASLAWPSLPLVLFYASIVLMALLISSWVFDATINLKRVEIRVQTMRYTCLALWLGCALLLLVPGVAAWQWTGLELIALGATAVGALGGALFAIPKATEDSKSDAQSAAPRSGIIPNTNLGKVSDWLTTAVVGASLTQLTKIPPYINEFALYLGSGLCNDAYSRILAVGIVSYFPIIGFAMGFLGMRLFIQQAIMDADNPQIPAAQRSKVQIDTSQLDQAGTTPDQEDAAKRIVAIPLADLTMVEDKTAWARAQVVLKNWPKAILAFQQAIAMDPSDPKVLEDYAMALYQADANPDDVVAALDRALPLVKGDPVATARILGNKVAAQLYKPGAFDAALKTLDQLFGDATLTPRALDYYYRACANGQKWRTLAEDSPDRAALASQIIADTKAALRTDATVADAFRLVSDPNYPQREQGDDDLIAFAANNAEYRQLIGMNKE